MVKAKDCKNCWEYWSCVKAVREKCPVFINNYGQRCWFLKGCVPNPNRGFINCSDCTWYKEVSR